jgi:hypothetical protein
MIISMKKVVAQVSVVAIVLIAIELPAAAEPAGGSTLPQQVCKTFDIPAIICPPGQTLLDKGNTCHAGTVTKTFCHNAALLENEVDPHMLGTRELTSAEQP